MPVIVEHANGKQNLRVNQQLTPNLERAFVKLGTFSFQDVGRVVIGTKGADGYVIADSVQFIPVD